MKKNRNCSGTPIYPNYAQPMPMIGIQPQIFPQPMNNQPMISSYNQASQSYNNIEQQINNMQQQINSLENRISKLESKSTTSYTNKYNDSNYYML